MKFVLILPLALSICSKTFSAAFTQLSHYLQGLLAIPVEDAALLASAGLGVETLALCLLIWPRTLRAGCILAAGLASAYAVLHAMALVVGDPVPCPCLGVVTRLPPVVGHALMLTVCVAMIVSSSMLLTRGLKRDASPRVVHGGAPCAT